MAKVFKVKTQIPPRQLGLVGDRSWEESENLFYAIDFIQAKDQKEAMAIAAKYGAIVSVEETTIKPKSKRQQAIESLLSVNSAQEKTWHEFVCEYLVLVTGLKKNRDLVSGYQLKKNKKGYSIRWGGRDIMLNDMAADVAYSFCLRHGLSYFVREAENYRMDLLA